MNNHSTDIDETNDSLLSETGPLRSLADSVVQQIRRTTDGRRAFLDVAKLPWIQFIEAEWHLIRVELDCVLNAVDLLPGFENIQAEQLALTSDNRWKIFPVLMYGKWITVNVLRCPETTRLIKTIPGIRAAMFSILQRGKELAPHRGNYCGILRYHLGLKIPKPIELCGISVGGAVAQWEEGKSLVFDDTHLHHAWNRSAEDRVVLFVDFDRPLPANLAKINSRVIDGIGSSTFMQNSLIRWNAWEARYGSALDTLVKAKVS
jgi:ornithine lipid ester-linked acyl 2-hydroxylase